jgi:hypothetical protein
MLVGSSSIWETLRSARRQQPSAELNDWPPRSNDMARRCSTDEVQAAFQQASVQFASRLVTPAVEKLIDDLSAARLGGTRMRGLFWDVAIAKIALARRIQHGSSSRRPGRHAGSLANASIADERIGGLLIKRRRLLEAVGYLERRKSPLRLRAYDAIE